MLTTRECDLLILDEPTRGIDVGAKLEIYNIITDLAKKGYAILMISSEMPELLGMCDGTMRMPLTEMEPQNVEKLKKAMEEYGVL